MCDSKCGILHLGKKGLSNVQESRDRVWKRGLIAGCVGTPNKELLGGGVPGDIPSP
jgi:hypothetical protein